MRLVVADDVLLTRHGIVHVLRDEGFDVVAEVGDAASLLDCVRRLDPDIAVVDIRMPPTHSDEGLRAARELREEHPNVGVLVLSQYVEPTYALQLVETHPERTGYLLKERVFAGSELTDALRRLHAGGTVIDPTIVAAVLERPRSHSPVDHLSPREREVLALVAEGLSNQAIASRLFIAERTVETHITQVLLKLGIDERPDSHRRVLAVLTYLRA